MRPAARLSAPTWVSRIEPATSEKSVTTWTPERTSSLIASLTGGTSGAISATPFAVGHLRQAGGELVAVAGVEPVGDLGDVLVAEVAGRLRDLPVDQLEERRLVGRQDEGEAEVGVAARPAALRRRADLGDHLQHPLHRVGVDARPLVEHPIDRGRAHAGTGGDFGDGGRGGHAAMRVGCRQSDHINK